MTMIWPATTPSNRSFKVLRSPMWASHRARNKMCFRLVPLYSQGDKATLQNTSQNETTPRKFHGHQGSMRVGERALVATEAAKKRLVSFLGFWVLLTLILTSPLENLVFVRVITILGGGGGVKGNSKAQPLVLLFFSWGTLC